MDLDGDGFDPIAAGGSDCDDTNPFVFPGFPEIPDDGIDQDCDGSDLAGAPLTVEQILFAGFNTVVFSGANDTPIADVVDALGSVEAVFRFDPSGPGWDVHRPDASLPRLNTLATVHARDVLFVRLPLGGGGDWAWPDALSAGPVSVLLGPGFTFVGYTGDATALADLLAGLDGVRAAFRFDAAMQGYDTFRPGRPPFLSTFSEVERLEGIFLLNEGPSTTLTWEQVGGGAPPGGVIFPHFANVSSLILAGSTAVAISDGLPVLRLTDANSHVGTAFTRMPIALGADGSFQSTFSFQIGSPGGATDLAGRGAGSRRIRVRPPDPGIGRSDRQDGASTGVRRPEPERGGGVRYVGERGDRWG